MERLFTFKMTKEMAKSLVSCEKRLKGKSLRDKDIQKYLCDVVNNEFGLLGTCIKVDLD